MTSQHGLLLKAALKLISKLLQPCSLLQQTTIDCIPWAKRGRYVTSRALSSIVMSYFQPVTSYSTGSGGSSLVYSAIGTELTSPIGQSFAGYAASSTSTNDPGLSKLDRASRAASIEHSGSTASLQQYVYGIAATLCGWSGPRAPDPFPNPFGAPAVFVSESRLQRCSFAFAC